MKIEKPLLKEFEAAEYLRLSVYTLRNIRKAGLITYIRLSEKAIRYTEEQLLEYQQNHLKQAA